jgi:ABC-2 type transport system ATP-binding protein
MPTSTDEAPAAEPAAASAPAAITARGIKRAFGDLVALDGLDLTVPEASIFGFIGPSGSGKSTAVRILSGIDVPDEGEVTVLGGDPVAFSAAERARLGYMPQLSVLFPALSLRENLSFVASLYGMPLRRSGKLAEALRFVELYEKRRTRLRDSSGGMQRRLALAAALVHDPEVLFLDEPTAGIDPVLRRKFWEHFGELRDRGRTLFVTTQYVSEAAYCDVVAVLNGGRVVAVDQPEALRRRAFGGDLLDITTGHPLSDSARDSLGRVEGVVAVRKTSDDGRAHRVVVDDASSGLVAVQEWLDRRELRTEEVRQHVPQFDDVFVELVQGSASGEPEADVLAETAEERA